jgi:hypothetical protein
MIDPTNPANGAAIAAGLTEGFTQAFLWSAGFMLVASLVWVFMINADKDTLAANDSPTAHIG